MTLLDIHAAALVDLGRAQRGGWTAQARDRPAAPLPVAVGHAIKGAVTRPAPERLPDAKLRLIAENIRDITI